MSFTNKLEEVSYTVVAMIFLIIIGYGIGKLYSFIFAVNYTTFLTIVIGFGLSMVFLIMLLLLLTLYYLLETTEE